MKTLVNVINGRKDFPVFVDMTEGDILNHLQETTWSGFQVSIDEDKDIKVVTDDGAEYFRIIDIESVSVKPKKKWRVYASVETRCYIDVEAKTKDEALQMGEYTDGGDFINEDDEGDWNVYDAVEL